MIIMSWIKFTIGARNLTKLTVFSNFKELHILDGTECPTSQSFGSCTTGPRCRHRISRRTACFRDPCFLPFPELWRKNDLNESYEALSAQMHTEREVRTYLIHPARRNLREYKAGWWWHQTCIAQLCTLTCGDAIATWMASGWSTSRRIILPTSRTLLQVTIQTQSQEYGAEYRWTPVEDTTSQSSPMVPLWSSSEDADKRRTHGIGYCMLCVVLSVMNSRITMRIVLC